MKIHSGECSQGYTILETLTVVTLIGILSAIASPSWFAFLRQQRLIAAQREAYAIIREAQANAKRENRTWEASFRELNGKVQWSVHQKNLSVTDWTWNDLIGESANSIAIDHSNSTFRNSNQTYHIQFKYNGWVNGQLGRISFITPQAGTAASTKRRCVFVSTLLGAMRNDRNENCKR